MRPIFKTFGLAGLASALALMVGTAGARPITVGYVPANLAYPYNVATAKGFQDAAKAAGVKTVVLDPKGSVETQADDVDDLIAQKVAGIGILPLDSVVAQGWVDRATEDNIPVVSIAVQVGDPQKRPVTDVYPKLAALVTTDDVLAGERAGELAAKLLPKGHVAKIGIIEGAPGYAVIWQRTKGFKQGLDKAGVKYEIVASQPTDWTPEQGEAVCQNILTAHPDLDLFFSQADDMAIGCSRAVRAADSHAKLVATGGGSHLGIDAIKAGEIDGSVCTRPGLLGRLMFKALYNAVTNLNAKKAQFVTYPLVAITKNNLSECPPEW